MRKEILSKLQVMFINELEHHPQSSLIDFYKLYMQSAFGPGHIINDENTARAYLAKELVSYQQYTSKFTKNTTNSYLENMKAVYREEHQGMISCPCVIFDCEIWIPLARYSTQLIADGIIPFEAFLGAFIESANLISEKISLFADLDKDIYIKYWKAMLPFFVEKKIKNFSEDSILIEQLFSENKYLVRHSYTYNEEYKPSYRIINKSLLSKYDHLIVEKYFIG